MGTLHDSFHRVVFLQMHRRASLVCCGTIDVVRKGECEGGSGGQNLNMIFKTRYAVKVLHQVNHTVCLPDDDSYDSEPKTPDEGL